MHKIDFLIRKFQSSNELILGLSNLQCVIQASSSFVCYVLYINLVERFTVFLLPSVCILFCMVYTFKLRS